jgi:flagellum-specific peptidoglycan hydrolase FlgJ
MTDEQRRFLEQVRTAAERVGDRDVPVAVVIAQAVLESGWGRSGLTRSGNALFGIKADPSWRGRVYSGTTREWEGGRYVTYRGSGQVYVDRAAALAAGCHPATLFRAYASLEDSIRDHGDFLRRNPRYDPCLAAYRKDGDARGFARCIHRAGYATGPDYATTLIRLMEELTPDLLSPREAPNAAPPVVFVRDRPLPPQSVRVIDGQIWVRLRPTCEAAGWGLTWDEATRTARVTPP